MTNITISPRTRISGLPVVCEVEGATRTRDVEGLFLVHSPIRRRPHNPPDLVLAFRPCLQLHILLTKFIGSPIIIESDPNFRNSGIIVYCRHNSYLTNKSETIIGETAFARIQRQCTVGIVGTHSIVQPFHLRGCVASRNFRQALVDICAVPGIMTSIANIIYRAHNPTNY